MVLLFDNPFLYAWLVKRYKMLGSTMFKQCQLRQPCEPQHWNVQTTVSPSNQMATPNKRVLTDVADDILSPGYIFRGQPHLVSS